MTNPTDDFTKAVESALGRLTIEVCDQYDNSEAEKNAAQLQAEALASIQASHEKELIRYGIESSKEMQKFFIEKLEGLKAELPTKFSPANKDGFSGGWHVDTYKLAVEDFRQDIDQLIKDLSND